MKRRALLIGTAGWAVPKAVRDAFPPEGTQLERYASRFPCVEINSSTHRPHRPATYARWARSVPAHFQFSLKLPKEITHKRKLRESTGLLTTFLQQTGELGDTLGVYVVQLAPSHAYDDAAVEFFAAFRERFGGRIACEPRHPSWAGAAALTTLEQYRITRIGADPVLFPGAEESICHGGFCYFRWHGSPRTYYSAYSSEQLTAFAARARSMGERETWCIFDNTATGAATGNALEFLRSR